VQFVVQNNAVTTFTLTYDFPVGFCIMPTTVNAPISNGGFGFTFHYVPFPQSTPEFDANITGALGSPSAGLVDVSEINWISLGACGTSFPVSTGSAPATSVNVSKQ
jgi:hypothetical protein